MPGAWTHKVSVGREPDGPENAGTRSQFGSNATPRTSSESECPDRLLASRPILPLQYCVGVSCCTWPDCIRRERARSRPLGFPTTLVCRLPVLPITPLPQPRLLRLSFGTCPTVFTVAHVNVCPVKLGREDDRGLTFAIPFRVLPLSSQSRRLPTHIPNNLLDRTPPFLPLSPSQYAAIFSKDKAPLLSRQMLQSHIPCAAPSTVPKSFLLT